jgi:hypothetical protein
MLTLFTTAKPFRGHSGVIQRNALQSWTLLHPDVEVILFGDEEGAAQVCAELGLRHEPHVERNESGLKRIDYYFDRAQEIARYKTLCYVNCDIILTPDFCNAVKRVQASHRQFLMVGQRWDIDITDPIDFSDPNWAQQTVKRAIASNHQREDWWIDYFLFSSGLYYKQIPPFVIGRIAWDNWLLWKALRARVPVVDASAVVRAIHQNHDYGYHPLGKHGVWSDEQARRNLEYAQGINRMRTIADATQLLRLDGLKPNPKHYWRTAHRGLVLVPRFLRFEVWHPIWFSILDITRPARTALGLRAKRHP